MADDAEDTEDAPKKSSKMPMIIGLVLALVGGGGGFYAASSGMILGSEEESSDAALPVVEGIPDIGFVPIEPITISVSEGANKFHLRFSAQLEVPNPYKPDVELLVPRVVDVINSYMRALDVSDLEKPTTLARLRAQLLRRIQIVTGEGRVNDLLIMEFIIN